MLSSLLAWNPSPGPVYTTLTTLYSALPLPKPKAEWISWVHGQSPMSTYKEVTAAIVTYLLVIFGGRELMRNRPAFKLTALFQIHNIYLTVGSLLVLLCMLEEIIPLYLKHGAYKSICSPKMFTPRLVTYYMINYYIKYIELIDTVFLVLKKKPLQFLHVFHHAATAILCFTQLEGETSVQWVVIVINLAVHVVMYYYYYATAGGAKIWWKRYLTTMQITQFIIDISIVFFASTLLFVYRIKDDRYPLFPSYLLPSLPSFLTVGSGNQTYNHFGYTFGNGKVPIIGDCAGSEGAALFGCGLLTSYLFLFIAFYRNTYKKAAKGKAVANGSKGVRGSEKSKVIIQGPMGVAVVTEVGERRGEAMRGRAT